MVCDKFGTTEDIMLPVILDERNMPYCRDALNQYAYCVNRFWKRWLRDADTGQRRQLPPLL
ncbi:MAG: hypothetical protein ACLTE2_05640 [Eubacteriales bacterium]